MRFLTTPPPNIRMTSVKSIRQVQSCLCSQRCNILSTPFILSEHARRRVTQFESLDAKLREFTNHGKETTLLLAGNSWRRRSGDCAEDLVKPLPSMRASNESPTPRHSK